MKTYGLPLVDYLPLIHQGKTRDIHRAKTVSGKRHLLIVATDRLSTHNIVHVSRVPRKGEVLTCLTLFILVDVLRRARIPHHLVAFGKRIFEYLPGAERDYPPDLHERAIIVEKTTIVPIEFIFRAYLTGSLWTKYYAKMIPDPYGLHLPNGLPRMHRFPKPEFTPTDKSETDDERNADEIAAAYPEETTLALNVFVATRTFFNRSGLELVDGKFEIGWRQDRAPILCDEISPDSCRLCDLVAIREGVDPPWKDKQIARDEAEACWGDGPRAPITFKERTVQKLTDVYLEVFFQATGTSLEEFKRSWLT